jgi:hypothetical protein
MLHHVKVTTDYHIAHNFTTVLNLSEALILHKYVCFLLWIWKQYLRKLLCSFRVIFCFLFWFGLGNLPQRRRQLGPLPLQGWCHWFWWEGPWSHFVVYVVVDCQAQIKTKNKRSHEKNTKAYVNIVFKFKVKSKHIYVVSTLLINLTPL